MTKPAPVVVIFGGLWLLASCAPAPQSPKESVPATSHSGQSNPGSKTAANDTANAESGTRRPRSRQAVQLGSANSSRSNEGGSADGASATESVVSALQPLQVLLGKWTGTTRKALLDQPEWVWDFQTQPEQPALVIQSTKGVYIREGRLTYLPSQQQYELTAKDEGGVKRVYRGDLVEPIAEVAGDDKQTHRTYKLELTQTEPAPDDECWQVALAQLDNNRYLLEWNRRRGAGAFQRVDTVNSLREGTSFASVNPDDYGDKTCIISEGLGTIAVTHAGRQYWVCCTGCKAAFEENPEKWIARLAAKQSEKKSMK